MCTVTDFDNGMFRRTNYGKNGADKEDVTGQTGWPHAGGDNHGN